MKSNGTGRVSWPAAAVVFGLAVVSTAAIGLAQPTPAGLTGTSWQLVRFVGADGIAVTPDERGKYTIEFDAGQLRVRIDCNRGRGTWQSSGDNKIEFGMLALTRARCPEGSLHDQIVKHWTDIRSYTLKGGHLLLSVAGDRGTYEFEPVTSRSSR